MVRLVCLAGVIIVGVCRRVCCFARCKRGLGPVIVAGVLVCPRAVDISVFAFVVDVFLM